MSLWWDGTRLFILWISCAQDLWNDWNIDYLWRLKKNCYVVLKQGGDFFSILETQCLELPVVWEGHLVWYLLPLNIWCNLCVFVCTNVPVSVGALDGHRGLRAVWNCLPWLLRTDWGPLGEQQALFTAEPSFLPQVTLIFLEFFCSFVFTETTYRFQTVLILFYFFNLKLGHSVLLWQVLQTHALLYFILFMTSRKMLVWWSVAMCIWYVSVLFSIVKHFFTHQMDCKLQTL